MVFWELLPFSCGRFIADNRCKGIQFKAKQKINAAVGPKQQYSGAEEYKF